MKKMYKIINVLIGIGIALLIINNNHILFLAEKINDEYEYQIYIDVIANTFLIIYSLISFYKFKYEKINLLEFILLFLLSISYVISNSFISYGSLTYIYTHFISSLVLFLSMFILLYVTIVNSKKILLKKYSTKKENNYFNKYTFIISFVTIILCWLIYIIAFYPVIMSKDPSYQIMQFFNIKTKYVNYVNLLNPNIYLTNHHPVFHTFLLGITFLFGKFLVNDNFGLFIFSFIQILTMASIFAYSIKYLKDNKVNNKILYIVLAIYSLVPMFPFYAMTNVKDTLYTCFIMIFVILIHKLVNEDSITIKRFTILLFVVIGITLLRNNGIYVIILSFPVIIYYCKKIRSDLLIIFIASILFYGTYTKVMLPSLGITEGSIREVLSIPFQQTARYVTYYDNELSNNDKKIINKVLKYKTLSKRYNPLSADPVKNKFNKNSTSKDLKRYFKVWFKLFFRHPLIYIDATLNNTYGYFSPQSTNWYIYYEFNDLITQNNFINYSYNNLEELRNILTNYGLLFPYIPVIGLISNIGFNTWLLIGLLFYSIISKKKKNIAVICPLLISLLICVASPVNTYFRYAMPIVFSMPFIFTLIVKSLKKQ